MESNKKLMTLLHRALQTSNIPKRSMEESNKEFKNLFSDLLATSQLNFAELKANRKSNKCVCT